MLRFVDTYKNLTLKSVASLDWSLKNCQSANYFMKVDDDLYFDLQYFGFQLNQLDHTQNSIYGFNFYRVGSFDRNPDHYHYVPNEVSIRFPMHAT